MDRFRDYSFKNESVILEAAVPSKTDLDPLYSSFNPKGVFRPPPSSKEALQRQVKNEENDSKRIQVTNHSQNMDADTTAFHMLESAKTSVFKRVKTAFRKHRNSGIDITENNFFNNGKTNDRDA